MGVLSVSLADQSFRTTANTTLASVPIGTASSDRVVIVNVACNNNTDPTSITIGGATGSFIQDGSARPGMGWIWANVPTGTTATVVMGNATTGYATLGVWATTGDPTASVVQTAQALQLSTPFTASTSAFSVAAGDALIALETADAGTTLAYTAGVTAGTPFTDPTTEVYLDGAKAYASPVSQVVTGSVTGGSPTFLFLLGARVHGTATAYTLIAAQGSFALAGVASALRSARKLSAAVGARTLTGVNASLKRGYVLSASVGSFIETGNAASFKRTYVLSSQVGSIAFAGVTAKLSYGRRFVVASGSFALGGQAATLRVGRKFAAAVGVFSLAGVSTNLRTGRVLPASPGTFSLTGQAAGLIRGRFLSAGTGSFALSGQAATLRYGRVLVAGKGAFVLTGFNADLIKATSSTYTLSADPGAFFLTGIAASLIYVPVIGLRNPLERLKMYTGTLGAVSNREDWIVNISFVDDEGNALDISGAQSIGTYVCRQGCPNSPVLTATLADRIVLTDNFTIQWAFTETDMQALHPAQYDVFCRVELNDITTQILSASVAIIEGGPRQ